MGNLENNMTSVSKKVHIVQYKDETAIKYLAYKGNDKAFYGLAELITSKLSIGMSFYVFKEGVCLLAALLKFT